MLRKSTLVLIILISGLMFYTGCDDGGGEGGMRGGGGIALAPVPQTGQMRCWGTNGNEEDCATDGRGQDGDIQAGVLPPVPRFTDNGEGQITDNLTGLVWLKDMDCLRGTRTWQEALNFANTLANGQCGLTDGSRARDWRLPNRNELRSLLDLENPNPALPKGHPFINVRNSAYWSSTTYRRRTRSEVVAWKVEMNFGRSFGTSKGGNLFVTAVRAPRFALEAPAPVSQTGQIKCWNSGGDEINCAGTGQDGDIRAGVKWPVPRFTDNGNGTITDNLTGLIWLKDWDCRTISPASWSGAIVNVRLGLKDGNCGLSDGSAVGGLGVCRTRTSSRACLTLKTVTQRYRLANLSLTLEMRSTGRPLPPSAGGI